MSRSGERNAENTTKMGTASNNAVNKTAKRQPLEFERLREKIKAPAVGALAVEVSICQLLTVICISLYPSVSQPPLATRRL